MMKRAAVLVVLCALWLVPELCAQPASVRELQRRAEDGDVEAQFDLAMIYANGEGVLTTVSWSAES